MPFSRYNSAGLVLLAALTVAGCVGGQRAFDEAAYAWEAKRAYRAATGVPPTAEVSRHFERGWRRGYTSVALGRDCCPPALPPHPYLGKKYQCPSGQALVRLWYRGFDQGVLAARACGLGQQVVTREVDCRSGCRVACLSPVSGVLPDPSLAMMHQYPGDTGVPARVHQHPTMAPPVAVQVRTEGIEAEDVAAEKSAPEPDEPADDTVATLGSDDRPDTDVDIDDEQLDSLDYVPSETTPIVFPTKDLAPAPDAAEVIEAEPLPPSLTAPR